MKTPRALYRVPPLLISVSGRSNSPSSTQEIALKKKKKCHFPLMVQKLKIHILSHSQLKEEKYEHEFAAEKCIDRLLTYSRKNQQKITHWNFRSFQSQLSLS